MHALLQEHVREETFDEAAKQEAEFFSYIATSYKHYLNGDDEECERVDGAQRQSFLDRAEAAQRQVQDLDQVKSPPSGSHVRAPHLDCSPWQRSGNVARLSQLFSAPGFQRTSLCKSVVCLWPPACRGPASVLAGCGFRYMSRHRPSTPARALTRELLVQR